MRLHWDQVEPALAARAAARDENAGRLPAGWSVFALFVSVLIIGLYLNTVLHLTGAAATLVFSLVPVALIALVAVPEAKAARPGGVGGRVRQGAVPRGVLSAEAAHRLFPEAVQTRAEMLYVETLLLLAEADEDVPEAEGRDLLWQCGQLLTASRRVERSRGRVRSLLKHGRAREAAAAELAILSARHRAETDPVVRESLNESRELCERRHESLSAMEPMQARLDAQEETICQALLLAQTALMRREAAAVVLDAPSVAGLSAAVERITRETRAMEEAAYEIVRLT